MAKRPASSKRSSTRAHAKATVGGAQSPAAAKLSNTSVPGATSKYDKLSVYDPSTKTVIEADGTRRSATNVGPTLDELSAMPGSLAVLDRLYVCETADEKTIATLAELAGVRISTLESKRLDWISKDGVDCPAVVPLNRRRCMSCPRWVEAKLDELPF